MGVECAILPRRVGTDGKSVQIAYDAFHPDRYIPHAKKADGVNGILYLGQATVWRYSGYGAFHPGRYIPDIVHTLRATLLDTSNIRNMYVVNGTFYIHMYQHN